MESMKDSVTSLGTLVERVVGTARSRLQEGQTGKALFLKDASREMTLKASVRSLSVSNLCSSDILKY